MTKNIFVYDDSVYVSERIKTIIGKTSFGGIILKRKTLFKRILESVKDVNLELIKLNSKEELKKMEEKLSSLPKDIKVFHLFSSFALNNEAEFKIIANKVPFVNQTIKIESSGIAGFIFVDKDEYINFLKKYEQGQNIGEIIKCDSMEVTSFTDISNYENLLYYISGGFDARVFNSLKGNEYIVTKSSNKKKKILMEYTYYQLLPDEMKKWMVMPYDYKELKDSSQYTMERLHMTDIAIRWTHGAVDLQEFDNILKTAFFYINTRSSKKVTKKAYEDISNELYIRKIDDRINEIKQDKYFNAFSLLIKSGTEFENIDQIIDLYKKLYLNLSKNINDYKSVIGHGDLCFSNMLYDKQINMLKLIDPKGALTEEELWTNPYYDIAKLSHSICGKYDFFNCGSYQIELGKNLRYELNINFNNEEYVNKFKNVLEENNYDYNLVRLYEASLFLSMLPLHMDNPHKVFGFLLNAINILREVERNVQ